jgi:MFS transporter, putative metabolite:H+ symporter
MTDSDERPERRRDAAPSAGVSGGEVFGGTAGEELSSLASTSVSVVEHSPKYLRTLLWLLLAATFFEGYDGAILALVLPAIRDTFNVAESQLGVSRAIIELGLGAAFFLARAGDRWGRRSLLLWSVLGYTVMTGLTAVSWDLWSFTAFQSLSRVFLGAEYAVAVTMIVEEFPKERRARTLGLFLMCSAVGAVAVALLLLAGITDLPLEWRTLYLVGVIPLLFLAVFRRGIKETQRFTDHRESVERGGGTLRVNFFEPWRPHYRRTLVLVGLIHLMRSLPLFGATSWFFYFAEREAGMSSSTLYLIFIVAYGFGTVGYWVCGLFMDRYGRRPTAIGYGMLAAVSSMALFQARGPLALGVLLVVAVFFGLGMAPVTGAISTELFPTYIRNQSAAWCRNIFEIAGFILGPLLVGVLGDHYTGALGSIGDTVTVLVLLFIPATWLIWRHLPETRGRELEEIEQDLGLEHTHLTPAAKTSSWRPWATFAGVIVGMLLLGYIGVAALSDVTRRPAGAAERFLQAVDEGEAKDIEQYGTLKLAQRLFGRSVGGGDDEVDFERIEIFPSQQSGSLDYVSFLATPEDAEKPTGGTLLVSPQGDAEPPDLKVVGYSPALLATGPSGPEPAPRTAWPIAVIVVVGVTLIAELVLRSLRADDAPTTTARTA